MGDRHLKFHETRDNLGAPAHVSDRLAGSIALTASVEATNPMMLTLAVNAAREIERVLADLEGGRNRALVTAFANRAGVSRGPVVVLTPEAVLSNTAGLAYITPEHHPLLWEAVTGQTWGSDPQSITFDLPTGPARALVHRIADPSGPAFRVEFRHEPPPGRAAKRCHSAVTIHPLPVVDDQLLSAVRIAATIAVDGRQGTGKLYVSRNLAALDRHRALRVVDISAIETRDDSWMRDAQDTLSGGGYVIFRHLEDLDSRDVKKVKALSTMIRADSASSDVATGGRLLLNVDLHKAPGHVAELVKQTALKITLPDLRNMKEHIPQLAETILAGLDGIKPGTRFSSSARQALMLWLWAGNIGELRQTMLEVAATKPGWMIQLDHLPLRLRDAAQGRHLTGLERAERDAIVAALAEANGNRSTAAAEVVPSSVELEVAVR